MTVRIVIIGGGQAGGWAAKTLRDEGFDGEICVIAEEEWDFYERPPLSKAALLEAEPALPRLFSAEAQQALNLKWYRPQRAEAIDREARTVRLSGGERLAYDRLLIATGGRARLPGEAWAQHPQVYTLRHWQDARRLKARLAASTRLAIVGGGWIGLEIAASARKSGVEVTLYEQQPALCMRSVSGEVSQELEWLHREQGVNVRTGCGALGLEDSDGLPVIRCDGRRQTFDAVVVGIGVELNLELAQEAGLPVDRGGCPGANRRSGYFRRRRCRPPSPVRIVHSVVGLCPESGGSDGEGDARSAGRGLRRSAVAVVGSIRAQHSDPRDPPAGNPDAGSPRSQRAALFLAR